MLLGSKWSFLTWMCRSIFLRSIDISWSCLWQFTPSTRCLCKAMHFRLDTYITSYDAGVCGWEETGAQDAVKLWSLSWACNCELGHVACITRFKKLLFCFLACFLFRFVFYRPSSGSFIYSFPSACFFIVFLSLPCFSFLFVYFFLLLYFPL